MSKDIDVFIKQRFPDYCVDGTEEYRDDFWHNLSEKDTYAINAEYLKVVGDPQYDYLVCWEPGRFDNDKKATDYYTILDIDREWWEFQKTAQLESLEQYRGDPDDPQAVSRHNKSMEIHNERFGEYKIYLTGDWYRLYDGDTFLYSQFVAARWYIYYQCENLLETLREESIPHSYNILGNDIIPWLNERDPKKLYSANGRELELAAYMEVERNYQFDKLLDIVDKVIERYSIVLTGKTFRLDTGYSEENFDPFTNFIFFDEKSMYSVSPKRFLGTFKACQADFSELQKVIDEALEIVKRDQQQFYLENKMKFNFELV